MRVVEFALSEGLRSRLREPDAGFEGVMEELLVLLLVGLLASSGNRASGPTTSIVRVLLLVVLGLVS